MTLPTTQIFNLLPVILQTLDTQSVSGGVGPIQQATIAWTTCLNDALSSIESFTDNTYNGFANPTLLRYIGTTISLGVAGETVGQAMSQITSFVALNFYSGTQVGPLCYSRYFTPLSEIQELWKTVLDETTGYTETVNNYRAARINLYDISGGLQPFDTALAQMRLIGMFPAHVMPLPGVVVIDNTDRCLSATDTVTVTVNVPVPPGITYDTVSVADGATIAFDSLSIVIFSTIPCVG